MQRPPFAAGFAPAGFAPRLIRPARGRPGQRVEARAHLGRALAGVLLAARQHLGGEPRRRSARRRALQAQAPGVELGQQSGGDRGLPVIGRDPLQHGHRIEQLLARPLPLGQRRVAARVGGLALQAPQRQPHLGGGLAAAVDVSR